MFEIRFISVLLYLRLNMLCIWNADCADAFGKTLIKADFSNEYVKIYR